MRKDNQVARIIQRGLESGVFEEKQFGVSFCRACNTRHAKIWFSFSDQSLPFYVCLIFRPSFVVNIDGSYEEFEPDEFETIFAEEEPKHSILARAWLEFQQHPLVKNRFVVKIISTPPFLQIEYRII